MSIIVGPRLCSCCLEDYGKLRHLWLVTVGRFTVLFCPDCDGVGGAELSWT